MYLVSLSMQGYNIWSLYQCKAIDFFSPILSSARQKLLDHLQNKSVIVIWGIIMI